MVRKRLTALMSALLLLLHGAEAAEVAQAIWCDNGTLYFDYCEPLAAGRQYSGSAIAAVFNVPTGEYPDYGAALGWQQPGRDVKDRAVTVEFKEAFSKFKPKSCRSWFYAFTRLREVKGLGNLNTSEVTDMSFMFDTCIELLTLDVSGFDVRKVTAAPSMFYHCSSLTTIYCNKTWDIQSDGSPNANGMFLGCTALAGGVQYDDEKAHGTPETATPKGGYFTARLTAGANDVDSWDGYYGDLTLNGLTLHRDGQWRVLCLPVTLDNLKGTPLEGATLMELDAKQSSSDDIRRDVTLVFKPATRIEGGKPYIARWATRGADIVNPTFKSVYISKADENPVPMTQDVIRFYGSYKQVEITEADKGASFVICNNDICMDVRKYDAFSGFFAIVRPTSGGRPAVARVRLQIGETTLSKRLAYSWSGQGTEADPYRISAASQLSELAEILSGADAAKLKGNYFRQMANIAFDETITNNYTPVKTFTGHYDGGGFTISGLNVNTPAANAALFVNAEDGSTIKNVILTNSNITGAAAAGIAYRLSGTAVVENCHVLKDVSVAATNRAYLASNLCAGGIVAYMEDGTPTVTNCTSHAAVSSATGYAGGIVGLKTKGSVTNCIYLGISLDVYGNLYRKAVVGKYAGGTVENCYFTKPTFSDENAKLMPMEGPDNSNFLNLLHKRDEYLLAAGLIKEQIDYDLTMNGRTFAATQKADGSWKSKAYSVCLPFQMRLEELDNYEDIKLYRLHEVDVPGRVLQFTDDFPVLMAGEPYVIVVEKGSFTLAASDVLVKEVPVDPAKVNNAEGTQQTGWWNGTMKRVENSQLVEQNAYIIQSDGRFKRVVTKYSNVFVGAFRAYFSSLESLGFNAFKVKYIHTENGVETGDVADFPAEEYESDGDIPDDDTDGITSVKAEDRMADGFYDLQGRKLNGDPNKGIYIYHGKKVIK